MTSLQNSKDVTNDLSSGNVVHIPFSKLYQSSSGTSKVLGSLEYSPLKPIAKT